MGGSLCREMEIPSPQKDFSIHDYGRFWTMYEDVDGFITGTNCRLFLQDLSGFCGISFDQMKATKLLESLPAYNKSGRLEYFELQVVILPGSATTSFIPCSIDLVSGQKDDKLQSVSLASVWDALLDGLVEILSEPSQLRSIGKLHSLVYHYCASRTADLIGLAKKLSFTFKSDTRKRYSQIQTTPSNYLLDRYCTEWQGYQKACRQIEVLMGEFNKAILAKTPNCLSTKQLALYHWRLNVAIPISHSLMPLFLTKFREWTPPVQPKAEPKQPQQPQGQLQEPPPTNQNQQQQQQQQPPPRKQRQQNPQRGVRGVRRPGMRGVRGMRGRGRGRGGGGGGPPLPPPGQQQQQQGGDKTGVLVSERSPPPPPVPPKLPPPLFGDFEEKTEPGGSDSIHIFLESVIALGSEQDLIRMAPGEAEKLKGSYVLVKERLSQSSSSST